METIRKIMKDVFFWITTYVRCFVIPAHAGIQKMKSQLWIPACAGMTILCIAAVQAHDVVSLDFTTHRESALVGMPAPHCSIPAGDGRLTLYVGRWNETIDVQFRDKDGGMLPEGYAALSRGLRSADGRVREMHPMLLNLLDHLQDHFREPAVEIISGFRSPGYNAGLKAKGRGVATNSRHIQGDAADIHMDGVTESALRDYALSLGCGGVGFYPAINFVHVDLGRVRQWQERAGGRRIVGHGPIVVHTDKNNYFYGDNIRVTARNAAHDEVALLERFVPQFGKWLIMYPLHFPKDVWLVEKAGMPTGKYRIRFDAKRTSYSNEFYVKKI